MEVKSLLFTNNCNEKKKKKKRTKKNIFEQLIGIANHVQFIVYFYQIRLSSEDSNQQA